MAAASVSKVVGTNHSSGRETSYNVLVSRDHHKSPRCGKDHGYLPEEPSKPQACSQWPSKSVLGDFRGNQSLTGLQGKGLDPRQVINRNKIPGKSCPTHSQERVGRQSPSPSWNWLEALACGWQVGARHEGGRDGTGRVEGGIKGDSSELAKMGYSCLLTKCSSWKEEEV